MSILQYLTYASGVIFVIFFARKLLKYWTMPMHVRWELYPIPHEGKAHGGSFYEEIDHWKKARHKDHVAQYTFMVPEILFIRALYEDNKPLWVWSFPFHFGLYLSIGGLAFLVLGTILTLAGLPDANSIMQLINGITVILAIVGFILGAIGALGILVKRLTDPMLKDFTAPIDLFNLLWLGAIFVTGIIVWWVDPGFAKSKAFLISVITFKPAPPISTIHIVNLVLFAVFWMYFPFTHMTHMISKYFMWDKVKWDDNPNVGDPGVDAKIKEYLNYPVTWAAEHVGAEGGKKTWAEVCTTNPWAETEEKKSEG